jgi:DNA-binding transcriptional LysR family regulator
MNVMHVKKLDLNLLLMMDAMLHEQSVSKAAEALGVTQSAMSHALNRLRLYFDDPLFIKTGQTMAPTPKAEALREAVIDVMGTIRQKIQSEIQFNPSTDAREFTICVTDMGELVFVPPLLGLLRKLAPKCSIRTLRVPAEQIEGLLASGEADLALGTYRGAPASLYKQRLFMHGYTTIAHVDNKKIKKRISLAQFEKTPQIVVTLSGKSNTPFDSVLEEKGVKRRILVKTPHFMIVPMLIEQQPDLIATVPSELANVFARYGQIRTVLPPLELPTFAISQYWHPLFHHESALIWLRDLIKKSFETYPNIRTLA